MYILDYHVHSNFSPDSKAELEDIINNSLDKKIKILALTDHLECDEDKDYYSVEYFKKREEILKSFKKKYSNKIEIKIGVELGQPQNNKNRLKEIYRELNFDYVLGAQHKGLNEKDLKDIDFSISSNENVMFYFEELNKITKIQNINCIAHLDLVRRYASRMGVEIDLKKYRSEIRDILKSVIENGKGIEINTSGMRQKMGDFMPNIEILKMYKRLGGTIVTVGSDSHISQNVGRDILKAYKLLEESGFKYVALYRNGKVEFEELLDK